MNGVFIAFALFFVKHFVVDFLLQPPWMWKHKGTFAHPSGLVHAGLHGLTTSLIFYALFQYGYIGSTTMAGLVIWLGCIEFPIHYMIDFFKMNACKVFGWRPTTHKQFWYALGFDQLLHYMTYLALLMLWFR